ncbi:MAG: glycosyltransferase [Bacteroidota bacterium]|nr:glycosyltransferase [Bacteroidota bacterium]
MAPENITFDIIVPTYENPDELRACLAGLGMQTFRLFRVFICIDGESNNVRRLLTEIDLPFPHCILSHMHNAHQGRNATRNLALPYVAAPFLAMLDSDIVPEPTWLEEHYRLLQQQPCVSVGDVRYTNADENIWARYIQTRGKNKYRHGEHIPAYYFTTGNVALPTAVFVALGGQDARMHSYGGGDTEFALRLEKHFALPVLFNARAVGNARMNKSLAQALAQYEQFGAENLPYILSKHPGEQRIFGVQYLQGQRWRDRMLRLLALSPLSQWLLQLVPLPIRPLERAIVHFAVFSAIARGWTRRKHWEAQEVAAQ